MRIYMFKSQPAPELRAFAADLAGTRLPAKYAPWHAIGVVRPEADPPHKLPRKEIEDAIDHHGFQLWRMKPAAKKAAAEV